MWVLIEVGGLDFQILHLMSYLSFYKQKQYQNFTKFSLLECKKNKKWNERLYEYQPILK